MTASSFLAPGRGEFPHGLDPILAFAILLIVRPVHPSHRPFDAVGVSIRAFGVPAVARAAGSRDRRSLGLAARQRYRAAAGPGLMFWLMRKKLSGS
jgi:hypothetical protein